jgi:sulfofructose kinase
MQALFIGQAYIDITFVTDVMPTGDDKTVARNYAVSFGGNAVTAAFCCAKLGIAPDLLASVADDWLGRMFIDMAVGAPPKGCRVVALLCHAERQSARDRPLPRR